MSDRAPLPGILETLSASAAEERGLPLTMGPQVRTVKRTAYDQDAHTVTMALSSEEPVERSYGTEILSHAKGAIRTRRLEQGIALLFNHDMGQHLGVSTEYEISGGTLRTISRFGTNTLALEKEADVRSGILKDVSVGYLIHEAEVTEDTKTGHRTVLVTDWEPYEGSLVTVPADPMGSGVGRNLGIDHIPVKYTLRKLEAGNEADAEIEIPSKDAAARRNEAGNEDDPEDNGEDEEDLESERSLTAAGAAAAGTQQVPPPVSAAPNPTTETRKVMDPVIDVTKNAAEENKVRVEELRGLQKLYPTHFNERQLKIAEDLGESVAKVRSRIAEAAIREAEETDVPTIASGTLGRMSDKELRNYSLAGAYRAAANLRSPGTFTGKDLEGGLEREVSQDIQKDADANGVRSLGGGISIPGAMTLAQARAQRDIRTITSGGPVGAATNFTTVEATPIELLRYVTALLALGARYMSGMHGRVQMTKQTGAASSSWLAEGAAVTPTDPSFGFFTMQPNRLSMASAYDRTFLTLSALDIEGELARDRNAVLSRSLDNGGLVGPGVAPIPRGLLNIPGLAAILSGSTRANDGTYTAGAGAKPMTYVDYNNLEAAISGAGGVINQLSILTTTRVKAAGRSTAKLPGFGSDVIWPDAPVGQGNMGAGPLGLRSLATYNPALTGFTSGAATNCHAVVMGDFTQAMFADWGVSELIADQISGAATNVMTFWEHAYYDFNVRHIESFAACTTVLPS